MRNVAVWVAGALVVAAGVAGGRVLEARGAAPAAPGPVAFVNLGRVFQSYPRAKKLQDDLQGEADLLKTSITQKEGELRKAAQDLDARLSPGTPEYEQGRRRIELDLASLQYDQKAGLDLIRRKQVTGMAAVYREVVVEAERIASERGFSSVLTYDNEPIVVEEKGQVMGYNDLKLQMALRTAVWASPEVDLTKDVIAALVK